MRVADLLRQALFFVPLLLGAAAILLMPSRTLTPGAVFVILAIYAHAAARMLGAKGSGKAILFLETLPFFGLAVASLGKLEVLAALMVLGSGVVAAAAILLGEWLVAKGTATFTTSVGFIVACSVAGLGLVLLPPLLFLGLALVAMTITGYGVARRVHG